MPHLCPIGCGASINENEDQAHYESTCPRVPILCPYGCGQNFRREQLTHHAVSCSGLAQLRALNGAAPGGDPLQTSNNGIDVVGKWFKSLFTRNRTDAGSGGSAVVIESPGSGDAGDLQSTKSAVPPRLRQSGGVSSAPSSPSGGRKADKASKGGSSAAIIDHQRVSSAPPARSSSPLLNSNGGPSADGLPAIFGFIGPAFEQYAPLITPYWERLEAWYDQFRDSDQKSLYVVHLCVGLALLYFLSSTIIFIFKLFVFSTLTFSTAWTVHTSQVFARNEDSKRYAYVSICVMALYLFVVMH